MRFSELNDAIPYVTGDKLHVSKYSPYPGVVLAQPGRHQYDCAVPGGDAVIRVTCPSINWKSHPFTHLDLFADIEKKAWERDYPVDTLMDCYYQLITDVEFPPVLVDIEPSAPGLPSLLFLQTVQALAVIEHRRYAQHEAKFGGRYLPFRFAAGIVEKRWSAVDAASKEQRGRIGVEWLERERGVPYLTERLFNEA